MKAKFRAWKLAWWRRLARLYMWLATVEASLVLRKSTPCRVLLDNSAHWKGLTHESAWISTGEELWGGEIPVDTGYSARMPVHSAQNETGEYGEIKFLIALAHLARIGSLHLVTSTELRNEARRHPPGIASGYSYGALNAFSGVDIHEIVSPSHAIFESAEQQSARLLSTEAQPFKSLIPFFHPKDTLDVWHLHTAHNAGIKYFLTMDMKFCRKFEQASRRPQFPKVLSRPISPSLLANELRLREIPSYVISYLDADRTFFIRHDLHLPNERRTTRSGK